MREVKLRKVTIDDLDVLQEIGRQTFYETFAASNSEANMTKYLEEGFSTEKLATEVMDQYSEFYFAAEGDEVIGYLKLNFGPSQTELKDEKALEIERIYVKKEWHGKNIGQILYQKAIDIANQKMVNYVWLGVWEENKRAIRFYEKNGFKEFGQHKFVLGDDVQTDIMMKLQLVQGN